MLARLFSVLIQADFLSLQLTLTTAGLANATEVTQTITA